MNININVPWMFIAIFVSLSLFYYFNQKSRIRKAERRDRLREKHEEYLSSLLENIKKQDAQKKEDQTNSS